MFWVRLLLPLGEGLHPLLSQSWKWWKGEKKYSPNDLPVLKPKLTFVRSHKSPRAFLSPPQHALRMTWMMFVPQWLPLGLISLTMAISFSGSASQGLSSVCLWCMHASPPESRAEVWGGGWVQESHVVKNVAALRLWQDLLHKYRMK